MSRTLIVIPTLDLDRGNATAMAAVASAGCDCAPYVSHDVGRRGFTATANSGLEVASPWEDVCLLNDDIDCFPAGWLATLQRVMRSADDIGIVAPSGASQSTPARGMVGDVGLVEVNSVPFWCALMRAKMVAERGLLDAEFIHYSSDTWYCWQARAAGWRIVWARSVFLWHEHQGSGYKGTWRTHDSEVLRRKVREAGGKPWTRKRA